MNLKKLKNNKKGFTLIEIIVVVVILAVLMAVAVPAVMSYLNEADDAKYETAGRAVYTAVQTEWAKDYADGVTTGNPAVKVNIESVKTNASTRVKDDEDSIDEVNITAIKNKKGAVDGNAKSINQVECTITINGTAKKVTITGNKSVQVSNPS